MIFIIFDISKNIIESITTSFVFQNNFVKLAIMNNYNISNIVTYRKIDWELSKDFFYLTDIPEIFEPFTIFPDYYSYGILTKGSMDIEIDNRLYHITTDSFMIYRPQETLKIVKIEPETQGAFILFTRRFIQDFQPAFDTFFEYTFLHKHFGSYYSIKPDDHLQLSVIFNKIFDILSSIYSERWEISAKNLITTLINETDSIIKKYTSQSDYSHSNELSVINKFKKLANENFMFERNINFYANKLNISINYLYKVFRNLDQQTPAKYLNGLLLNEAKFLLSHSDYNISEIAYKLSFSDIFSFSRYFKKQTFITPSSFRAENCTNRKDKF